MNKIICISRQYASGGHEIGRQLSQYYSIPIYDRELIVESMKMSGLSRELIESNDENARNSIVYSIAMGTLSNIATPYIAPPADKVFQAQSDVIHKLAESGTCVIIGRCAGEILRNHPNVVRIFVYADKEFRLKRAIQYYGCRENTVADVLHRKDIQRATHFNHYNHCRWGSIDSFDLAIDSSKCSISGAVHTIKAYLDSMDKSVHGNSAV